VLSGAEGHSRAREAATKALEIDPKSPKALVVLGWIAMLNNDLAGASQHFERALALDPADLNVLGDAAVLLQALGRPDDALALHEVVARRDPVNVTSLYSLANAQRHAGRFDEAIASLRTALSLSPGRGGAHFNLGVALLQKGEASAALEEIKQETSSWIRIGLPMAYHALGRQAESDAALAGLIERDATDSAYNIAFVYAFRGEDDRAFEWLDKAVEYQDAGLAEIVEESLFDNIHSDPRWLPFLRSIGKAPEQLAAIEFKVTLPM
jgi:tetratricopeptide (TPR) repeat protein